MLILTTLILFALVLVRVYRSWSRSIPVDPYLSIMIPALLILVLPAFLVERSDLHWISITGIWTVCALSFIDPKFFRTPFNLRAPISPGTADVILGTLGALHFILSCLPAGQAIGTYGLSGAFQRDRLSDYLGGSINSADGLGTIRLISEMAFYLTLGKIFHARRYIIFGSLVVVYVGALSTYANTRLSIVLPVIAVGCFYCYAKRLRPATLLAIFASIILLLPWYIVATNAIRHGFEPSAETSGVVAEITFSELDYNKYIKHVDDYTTISDYEYGYGWFLSSFGNLVPRVAWKDKPVTSTSNRFTRLVTGQEPSIFNPVMTFTIFGEGYLQFGYLGVIFETVFVVLMFSKLFHSYMRGVGSGGELAAFNLMTWSLIFFRAEIPFVQILLASITLTILNSALENSTRSTPNSQPIRT